MRLIERPLAVLFRPAEGDSGDRDKSIKRKGNRPFQIGDKKDDKN